LIAENSRFTASVHLHIRESRLGECSEETLSRRPPIIVDLGFRAARKSRCSGCIVDEVADLTKVDFIRIAAATSVPIALWPIFYIRLEPLSHKDARSEITGTRN
jgi:hypothetical protein